MPYPIFQLIDPTTQSNSLRKNLIIISALTIINRAIWNHFPTTIHSPDSHTTFDFVFSLFRAKAPIVISGTLSAIVILLTINYSLVAFAEFIEFTKKKKEKAITRFKASESEELEKFYSEYANQASRYPDEFPHDLDPDDCIRWHYRDKVSAVTVKIEKDLKLLSSAKDIRQLFNIFSPLALAAFSIFISARNAWHLILLAL